MQNRDLPCKQFPLEFQSEPISAWYYRDGARIGQQIEIESVIESVRCDGGRVEVIFVNKRQTDASCRTVNHENSTPTEVSHIQTSQLRHSRICRPLIILSCRSCQAP